MSTDQPTSPDTIVLIHGFIVGQEGWEEVADFALDRARDHATTPTAA
jgi:hypothetical protein